MQPKIITVIILNHRGQAASEFVLAATFFLVPLFLIIPLLGKYIDIHHAAIQQARYEAWEYTAWNGPRQHIMAGIKDSQSAGRKKYIQTREEGIGIFFSNPRAEDYGTPQAIYKENPLWFDHRGDSLFSETGTPITGGEIRENPTPDPTGGIFDTILKVLSWVFQAFGEIMSWVGVHADFDAINTDSYFTSQVAVQVRSLSDILPLHSQEGAPVNGSSQPLTIKAKASVLTNPWNAGSRENASSETRGMVFTALLKPVSDTLNTFSSTVNKLAHLFYYLGFEMQAPGFPDFGYVSDDMVPLEHLNENKKVLKEAGIDDTHQGLFYYEEP